jgi:O-antigen/teichoic acid export membrane protein
MYFHFFPILSQQIKRGHGVSAMLKINAKVFVPSVLVLMALFLMRDSILPLLYDKRLSVDWQVAALFWTGDLLRVLACLYLMGLYSMHATKTITVWDIFSQPLFALLLLLGASSSMRNVGYAHLVTYLVYALLCIGSYFYLSLKFKKPAN